MGFYEFFHGADVDTPTVVSVTVTASVMQHHPMVRSSMNSCLSQNNHLSFVLISESKFN